jgi:hypothetical protein
MKKVKKEIKKVTHLEMRKIQRMEMSQKMRMIQKQVMNQKMRMIQKQEMSQKMMLKKMMMIYLMKKN